MRYEYLEDISLALSAAITALPTVISNIRAIITKIDDLSKKRLTPKDKLKEQNEKLNETLGKLKESVANIGTSIKEYMDIYTLVLEEENTAEMLEDQFSISKGTKQVAKGPSSANFKALQKLDRTLNNKIDENEAEIEKDDLKSMKPMLKNIQTRLNSADGYLSANPKNLIAAHNEFNLIIIELGNISTLINKRFKAMSKTLIDFKSSPPTPGVSKAKRQ
jgi:chromosome segregation ATPase